MILVRCRYCGRDARLGDGAGHQEFRCSSCGARLDLPGIPEESAPQSPPLGVYIAQEDDESVAHPIEPRPRLAPAPPAGPISSPVLAQKALSRELRRFLLLLAVILLGLSVGAIVALILLSG